MPYAIDQEALDSPNMKVLDINKPPVKSIPHQEYPKMVYLHPKDKAKEHRTNIVHTPEELEAAEGQGYKTKPHVPVLPTEDLSGDFEIEYESAIQSVQTEHGVNGYPPSKQLRKKAN